VCSRGVSSVSTLCITLSSRGSGPSQTRVHPAVALLRCSAHPPLTSSSYSYHFQLIFFGFMQAQQHTQLRSRLPKRLLLQGIRRGGQGWRRPAARGEAMTTSHLSSLDCRPPQAANWWWLGARPGPASRPTSAPCQLAGPSSSPPAAARRDRVFQRHNKASSPAAAAPTRVQPWHRVGAGRGLPRPLLSATTRAEVRQPEQDLGYLSSTTAQHHQTPARCRRRRCRHRWRAPACSPSLQPAGIAFPFAWRPCSTRRLACTLLLPTCRSVWPSSLPTCQWRQGDQPATCPSPAPLPRSFRYPSRAAAQQHGAGDCLLRPTGRGS